MALIQKAFSDIITFSRSSNATRIGPNGLVQYAPHNLVLQSQTFDNASWTKTGASVTANTAASPDGTVTADSLIEDATLNAHRVSQTISVTSGVTYTVSVFAKASTRTFLQLFFSSTEFGVNAFANFNLSTGVLGTVGSASTAVITSVGNGWYRCSMTAPATATGAASSGLIQIVTSSTAARNENYTGDGASGLFLWGAQLAVGPLALDYTPTTTAAVYGPRFDYDGSGVTSVDPIARNLVTYSQEFDNASWVKSGASATANTATAPDGTATADSLIESSGTSDHYATSAAIAFTAGLAYTLSCFVKPNGRTWFRLAFASSAFPPSERFAYFDVQNGVLGTVAANVAATITSVGNGWYRCAISRAATASATAATFVVICDADNNTSYTGDGTSGLYLWGAQLEVGSTATGYMVSGATNGFRAVPVVSGSATARGLLVEEQRTNLFTYSEQFENWVIVRSTVTSNATTSPDGTINADKLSDQVGVGSSHFIYNTGGSTAATHTISVYAKAGERTQFEIQQDSGGNARFTLTGSGTATALSSNTATITAVGNGWYRCTNTFTSTGAFTAYFVLYNGSTSYTGDGGGLFLWGAQSEVGSFATSYIPTVASTVTRSADVPTVNTLSPFYNAVEGTVYAEWDMVGSKVGTGYPAIAQFDDTTSTNYISIRQDGVGDSRRYGIVLTSSTSAEMLNLTAESLSANTVLKSALAYKANDFAFTRGSTLGTSSSGAISTVTNLKLGRNEAGAYINAHIRRIAYYPRRLTNAELQALTA